jgi:methylthioribose-1-phosphate isomerase
MQGSGLFDCAMDLIEAVRWSPEGMGVRIVDQRCLPERFVERDLRALDDVVDAIRTLAVRGAPAIGICGAMGVVAAATERWRGGKEALRAEVARCGSVIRAVRPTAVNLAWAVDRVLRVARTFTGGDEALVVRLRAEATRILEEDREMCRAIGEAGASLVPHGARVLTHCNAGALATGGMGTALAPIYIAAAAGREVRVFADETRPLLQGSRLTAWELSRAGIPVTVLADNMAATLMRQGRVDLCIVGADRIAANGDVANKIGTYSLAVLARHHAVPFYVAAPMSTVDASTATGAEIPIEHRPVDELALGRDGGGRLAPEGVDVFNPAFDVTPAELISGIITDRGIVRAPYAF